MTVLLHRPTGDAATSITEDTSGGIATVVVLSTAAGLLTAAASILLAAGAVEHVVTGLALSSFALGWALLYVLSTRRTRQPQTWAAVPAVLLGASGLGVLLLAPSDAAWSASGWIWPPVVAAMTAWMATRVRVSLRSWTRIAVVYPVLVVQLVVAGGGLYETVAEARDGDDPVVSGARYDIGDHSLYLECHGTGEPTVVLEAGLGSWSDSMGRWVAPAVARRTRVCVYDRAGYGHSDPDPLAPRPQTVAEDLHALLQAAGVAAPYVIGAHSSGAVYARIFADAYPDDVVGVAFLDGQPPEAMTGLPDFPAFYRMFRRAQALMPSLARLGVLRLAGSEPRAAYYRTEREEIAALPARLRLAGRSADLGDRPLAVVTAMKESQRGWLPLQDALAQLSTNSAHLTLRNAVHADLVDDRATAEISSRAILAVVSAVRTGRAVSLS